MQAINGVLTEMFERCPLQQSFCFWSDYTRGKPHGITPDRTRLGNEPDAKTFSMRIRRKQRGIEPAGE